ncbi:NAD(P)-binding protein [Mollisia scopiformis]|uniref:Methylenetetrahydrofolate dehydrogenase [NAD(+)] n=1 Tax=Mollisia scopiformis TaxID=149040 RepID=A0A194WT03_MOLSC|nr:NAD(P)-binding protein [Mollisia scopiformis]KUJ11083.1 NAD(P)-binding protein [Mollisia scopiformis]
MASVQQPNAPTPKPSNPTSSIPDTCKVVSAVTIAKSLLAEVAKDLQLLEYKPKLVGLLANEDEHAKTYAEYSAKTCKENGFDFDLRVVSKADIEESILAANTDKNVHGIIVYYPIFPSPRQDQYIQQLVALEKDVEGLSHKYIFNMYQNIRFLDIPMCGQKSILPCTPLAVVKVLEYLQIYNTIMAYGNRLFGKTITVINRSEVVGRPLAALLANDGAKVYSVDLDGVQIFTRGRGIKNDKHEVAETDMKLEDCFPLSDVVVTGVPSKAYKVDVNMLRDGAVCVNFSSDKNFDGPAVKQHASIYVPAIGKVTIAVLLRNLLRLCHNRDMAESYKHMARQARRSMDVCSLHGVKIEAAEAVVKKAIAAGYLNEKSDTLAVEGSPLPAGSKDKTKTDGLMTELETLWSQLPELNIKEQAEKQEELDRLLLALDESFQKEEK